MKTIFYIVRHGQSYSNESNANDEMTSSLEKKGSLTPLGRKQAEDLAKELKRIHFDAIIASDMTRARDTATIIGKVLQLPLRLETLLRERDRGKHLLGMNEKEIRKYLGAIYEEYLSFSTEQQFHHRFFDDYETYYEAAIRMKKCLQKISEEYSNKTVLGVTHGAITRAFLAYIGFAPFSSLPSGSFQNCGYIKLMYDGKSFHVEETKGLNNI